MQIIQVGDIFKVVSFDRNTKAGALTWTDVLVKTKNGWIRKRGIHRNSRTGHHGTTTWHVRPPFAVFFFDRTNKGHTTQQITIVDTDKIPKTIWKVQDDDVVIDKQPQLTKQILKIVG